MQKVHSVQNEALLLRFNGQIRDWKQAQGWCWLGNGLRQGDWTSR